MRKVITISGGKITIPKKMRDKYGLKNGDQLVIKNESGRIVIKALDLEKGEDDFGGDDR